MANQRLVKSTASSSLVAPLIGLPHIVDNAGLLLVKLFDGSADTGTLAVDSDEIEKNLFALNCSPDGNKVLDLYYLKG